MKLFNFSIGKGNRRIQARLNRIAGNRPRRACVPRSIGAGEELKLNSVDGRKVCGQPSEQSFKSATGRRCARGTSPESDATRCGKAPAGLVEYGWGEGWTEMSQQLQRLPPPASPARKKGKEDEIKSSRCGQRRCRVGLVPASGAVWARSVGGRGVTRPGV